MLIASSALSVLAKIGDRGILSRQAGDSHFIDGQLCNHPLREEQACKSGGKCAWKDLYNHKGAVQKLQMFVFNQNKVVFPSVDRISNLVSLG